MKKRQQLNYFIEVYRYLENEDFYESMGWLQKDGSIGYESIYTTNKEFASGLSRIIDSKGLFACVKDIREEKDLKIKEELKKLM